MDFTTWERIARRQIWYKQVVIMGRLRDLEASLDKINQKVPSVDVLRELRDDMVAGDDIADRLERHQKRMDRHLVKGLALVPVGGRA
jgi:hypothetical protein